jgi:hypothetical protein
LRTNAFFVICPALVISPINKSFFAFHPTGPLKLRHLNPAWETSNPLQGYPAIRGLLPGFSGMGHCSYNHMALLIWDSQQIFSNEVK